jgi:RND family efflux transporter MFP subunit
MDQEDQSGDQRGLQHPGNLSAWSKRPSDPTPDKQAPRNKQTDHDPEATQHCPDAIGRGEEEGRPDDLPKDLPKIPTGRIILVAILFLVLVIALFLAGYIPHHRANTKLAQRSAAIQTAKPIVEVAAPKRSDAAVALELPGDALPLQQASLYARSNGYLSKLYVDIGDHVTKGELLAEISAPEVDAQLAASRAALQQAEATEARAETDYNLANSTLQRYQGFFKSGGVTQQQLDERQTTFDQARANLKVAQAAVASAKADVQRLETLQGYEKVFAPFPGTITYRPYDVGALLNPASTGPGLELFDIARTDILRVFVNVPQNYATDVRTGQAGQLLVRNYPGQPFNGMVVRTAGAVDLRTRTLRIEVDFPNDNGRLLANIYGTVKLNVPRQTPQIIIPSSALIFDASGLRVAVLDEQKRIHFKKITVGRDFGTTVEVVEGLTGSEQVVANPGEKLAENVEVEVHPAPAGGAAEQPEQPQTPSKNPQKQANAG